MEDATVGEVSNQATTAISQEQNESIEFTTKTTSVTVQSESSHIESSMFTTQTARFEGGQIDVESTQESQISADSNQQSSVNEVQLPRQDQVIEDEVRITEDGEVQVTSDEIQIIADTVQVINEDVQPVCEEVPTHVDQFQSPTSEVQHKVEEFQVSVDEVQANIDEVQSSVEEVPATVVIVQIAPQSIDETSTENDLPCQMEVEQEQNVIVEPKVEENSTSTVIESSKETEDDIQMESREQSSAEIQEDNLRTQLNEIIEEIDIEEARYESGPFHHTWQPKGHYVLEKTEITHEEVVADIVPDIPDQKKATPPVPEKPLKKHAVVLRSKIEDESDSGTNSQGTKRPSSLKVLRNSLVNGDIIDLTDIPDGIPLLAKILPKDDEAEEREKIPLERLFTPATDWEEILPQKKKQFASSAFYGSDHPTIEDQVDLAHKISVSLIDENNKQSRGQSMYIKRKNKSSKWIHDAAEEYDESESSRSSKERPHLKLKMNSSIEQEFNSVQQNYEEILSTSQTLQQISGIEMGKEISSNLQSPTGKGAALFAKRKKRMDKFIVDETTIQQQQQQQSSAIVYESISTASTTTVNFQSTQENSYTSQEQSMSYDQQQSQLNTLQPSIASQSDLNLPDLTNILTKPVPPKKTMSNLEARGVKTQNTQEQKKQGYQPQSFPTPPTRKWKTICIDSNKTRNLPKKYYNASVSAGKPTSLSNGLDSTSIQDPLENIRPGSPPMFMDFSEQPSQPSLTSPFQSNQIDETAVINDGNAIYTAEVKLVQQSEASPSSLAVNYRAPEEDGSVLLTGLTTEEEEREKRKSFNLAPKGWGTYNNFYTPVHLGAR